MADSGDTLDVIVERMLDQFEASDAGCTEEEKIRRHHSFMAAAGQIASRHESRPKVSETRRSRTAAHAR